MARKRATLSQLLNDLTFQQLYNKYKLIAMNAHEWGNLPDGITERHIERELFGNGKAIFFRDKRMSYMCLQCDNGVGVNPYGDPTSYWATGYGYHKLYSADDCVVIENNMLRLATDPFLMFYVNKITEAERTMDVNVKANKTPVVFACDERNVQSFKQLFRQVDGNVPAHFVDKKLDLESIAVFDTKAKFLCNDLMDYKKSVENELLTFLGINNIAQDKKERLITDEAESNNQLIGSFADLQLEARQRACDAINEKYGLNVTVKKRQQPEGGVEDVREPLEPDAAV